MNLFFKTSCLFALLAGQFFGIAYAQLPHERKGIVEKDVLLVYLVGGQNVLSAPPAAIPDRVSATGSVIKSFSMGSVEDVFSYRLLPYDRKLPDGRPIPLELIFRDLVSPEPGGIYLYNDLYLAPNVMNDRDIYRELSLNSADYSTPTIPMDSLKTSNDVFIWYKKSYVGKCWVLKGAWEEFELNEKPQVLRGLTRATLQFDTYRVYLLKKIISIEPVNIVGHATDIEVVKGMIPTTKQNSQN